MSASAAIPRAGAVIVAAGASTRMGAAGDKTLADLRGQPLIAHTIAAFEECAAIEAVVLVAGKGNLDAFAGLRDAKGWRKTAPPVLGGARRQDSVRIGLDALPPECEWVVVHDGARPFVTARMIEDGLRAAAGTGAAVAVVPAYDTVKRVAPDGSVVETLDRSELALVQTPQVFRRDVLERAHAEITGDVTDDAAMAERIGVEVRTFEGARSNLKVTTPDDLGVAGALLREGAKDALDQMTRREGFLTTHEENVLLQIQELFAAHFLTIDIAFEQIAKGLEAISPLNTQYHGELSVAWFKLISFSFGSLRASMLALRHGYYVQSIGIARGAMEANLAAQDLEHQSEPLRLLQEIRKSDFTLNNMLQRLPESQREGLRGRYSDFSEIGSHLSLTSLELIQHEDTINIVGYYNEDMVRSALCDIMYELIDLLVIMGKLTEMIGHDWTTQATKSMLDIRESRKEIMERLH